MRCSSPLSLALAFALCACSDGWSQDQAATDGRADVPPATPGAPDGAAPTGAPEYQLLGVKDPDLGIVAYVIKIPRGWPAKQVFQRKWRGANPYNQIYVVFRSPDARQQIEYLPSSQYVYGAGPNLDNLRMQKQAMGIDPRMAENELPPMTALDYLREHVLPQLAQHGVTLRELGNQREVPPHPKPTPGSDQPHMAQSASVDGILPNGNRARVEVQIGWNEMRNNEDVYYSWWAMPSLIQTASGDLSAVYAHAETAEASVVYNPGWLKQNNDLMARGNEATSAAIRSQHVASMDNIAQWGRINAANAAASMARINDDARNNAARQQQNASDFNDRMARNDQNNELFTDVVINGEAKYVDPTTGERVKLDSSYDHTYIDNNGNYYLSNTPLRANDVNWQELEKVPFSDY